MSNACIFFPVSSIGIPVVSSSQRYRHCFGDERLERRYHTLLDSLIAVQTSVVGQLSESHTDRIGAYRFLSNPRVSLPELINEGCRISPDQIAGRHVLAIMDGTSISLSSQKKSLSHWQSAMGVVEDNRTPGFYLYPCLVVDKDSHQVFGVAEICLFTRPLSQGGREQSQRQRTLRAGLPFESKESYVWALLADNAVGRLSGAASVTLVMDRGADSYQVLEHLLADPLKDLLVRVMRDRKAHNCHTGMKGSLTSLLEEEAFSEPVCVKVRALDHTSKTGGGRVQRQGRKALMRVRYAKVSLEAPPGREAIARVLWVVQAQEDPQTVPEGEEAISWLLLTSLPANSPADAWCIVEAYQARWWVEQLFRGLKKDGIDIETIELQSSESIKKYTIMAIKAAAEALKLVAARDGRNWIPVGDVFDNQEQAVLEALGNKLQGPTPASQNPHPTDSLAWAAWIVARLGGWSGYQSQRPPGPATMSKGLEKLRHIVWATAPTQNEPM